MQDSPHNSKHSSVPNVNSVEAEKSWGETIIFKLELKGLVRFKLHRWKIFVPVKETAIKQTRDNKIWRSFREL